MQVFKKPLYFIFLFCWICFVGFVSLELFRWSCTIIYFEYYREPNFLHIEFKIHHLLNSDNNRERRMDGTRTRQTNPTGPTLPDTHDYIALSRCFKKPHPYETDTYSVLIPWDEVPSIIRKLIVRWINDGHEQRLSRGDDYSITVRSTKPVDVQIALDSLFNEYLDYGYKTMVQFSIERETFNFLQHFFPDSGPSDVTKIYDKYQSKIRQAMKTLRTLAENAEYQVSTMCVSTDLTNTSIERIRRFPELIDFTNKEGEDYLCKRVLFGINWAH